MPPPQHLLASKLRGFVCRSCLSKLQIPQRQRLKWVSRSFSTGNEPLREKGASEVSKSAARNLDEIPDEAPTELLDGLDDSDILEALKAEVRQRRKDATEHGSSRSERVPKSAVRYFEETPDGVRTELEDELTDEADLEALERELADMEPDMESFVKSLAAGGPAKHPHNREATAALENQLKAQFEELKRLELEKLSEMDLLRMKENFLKDGEQDIPPKSRSPAEKVHSTKTHKAPAQPQPSGASTGAGDDFRIPLDAFPAAQRSRIEELNEALKRPSSTASRRQGRRLVLRSSRTADASHVQRAWKAYSLSRHALMSSESLAPEDLRKTWKILWNIFQVEGPHNLDRMARLKTLGDDICRTYKVEYTMLPEQFLLHIEAEFIEGSRVHAIDMWTRRIHRCHTPDDRKKYWGLGVRMLAQHGQPDQALKAAENYIQVDTDPASFRILLPVIRSYLRLDTKASVKRAWALYIRLRVNLGSQMTIEDYDAVTSSFLSANQPDLALGAFKDMMLTGQSSMLNEDSTALYKAATSSHDNLTSLKISKYELDWQDSRSLSQLPARFNNKFFFGKWIKKLIGDGELKAAQQVFELMNVRRIQPSAIQMNGLIGAWFREGSENSRGLAEDMAWRMIKARTDFVEQRNCLHPTLRLVETKGLPSNISLSLTAPATIETFCILISQYRRRQKAERMSDLFQAFQKSRLQPNTSFMNELLLANTRAHDKNSAFETYQTATEEQDVPPDFDTYKILWGLLKKEVDPITAFNKPDRSKRFRKCRGLFADMIGKLPNLDNHDFPRDLYQLIVQSFSLAQDLAGTAVAMRALQRRFNMYPEPETARVIVLQLARLGLVNDAGFEPRRLNMSAGITRERVANVTKLLQGFKNQRVEALRQQGIDFDQLTGNAKLEEPLMLLSDLLRFAEQSTELAGSDKALTAAECSRLAAEQMGVPDCISWESHKETL